MSKKWDWTPFPNGGASLGDYTVTLSRFAINGSRWIVVYKGDVLLKLTNNGRTLTEVRYKSAAHAKLRVQKVLGVRKPQTIREIRMSGARIKRVSVPGYYITDGGRVFSDWIQGQSVRSKYLREITPANNNNRAMIVALRTEVGTRKMRQVHRLVLEAFVGPCPVGQECRHLDGNFRHNHLSNLKWGTPKQNTHDKFQHGTMLKGSQIIGSKLTDSKILEIKKLHASGVMQSEIADRFAVSRATICNIINGKVWRHVQL